RDAALLAHASRTGWPIPVDGGYLFVSTSASLRLLAGEHDAWTGAAMTGDAGFHWIVQSVHAGARYKFTDGTAWAADPWSRACTYDAFGEMSLVAPREAHLERHFAVGDAAMAPRTVRVWVPEGAVDRVLYVHDGQNLFDPAGPAGGWHLQDHAPPGVLLVGIDSTPARLAEYTHVEDRIEEGGALLGGEGDAHADFLRDTVRPLIRARHGEPGPIGIMGSSLGGLISFHAAARHPGEYAFAASLSGTMGWGSIGAGVRHETMIERYAAHTERAATLYLDSGGGGDCVDDDGDGIEDDDPAAADNYCENLQLRDVLTRAGSPYVEGESVFYAWHAGAAHDEAAWAARVSEPLRIFEAL
ncbi:alpha/beta hydrolase, partial [Sorangium cellulosum]|uniref:alpha/beta hydrolase n=1 Tax=Sorangium cellulosum TaxID=56 RepID=UPI000A7F2986